MEMEIFLKGRPNEGDVSSPSGTQESISGGGKSRSTGKK